MGKLPEFPRIEGITFIGKAALQPALLLPRQQTKTRRECTLAACNCSSLICSHLQLHRKNSCSDGNLATLRAGSLSVYGTQCSLRILFIHLGQVSLRLVLGLVRQVTYARSVSVFPAVVRGRVCFVRVRCISLSFPVAADSSRTFATIASALCARRCTVGASIDEFFSGSEEIPAFALEECARASGRSAPEPF